LEAALDDPVTTHWFETLFLSVAIGVAAFIAATILVMTL
jgi:hypothetical protein